MVSLTDCVILRGVELVISRLQTIVDQRVGVALTLSFLGGTFHSVGWVGFLWDFGTPVYAVVRGEASLFGPVGGGLRIEFDGLLTHGGDKVLAFHCSEVLCDWIEHLREGVDLVIDITVLERVHVFERDLLCLKHLLLQTILNEKILKAIGEVDESLLTWSIVSNRWEL